MANKKSAKKRAITNVTRNLKNIARKSEIKTLSKKIAEAVQANDMTQAKGLLKTAESKIAKAKGKKVLKKNTASRKISRLTLMVAKADKETAK